MSERMPLSGLKVIELGTLIAGPFCGRLLAEFGAEVIKIEPPGEGDPLRKWRMLYKDTSLWWYVQGRNKKSVTVNLHAPEGQEIVRRLARDAVALARPLAEVDQLTPLGAEGPEAILRRPLDGSAALGTADDGGAFGRGTHHGTLTGCRR